MLGLCQHLSWVICFQRYPFRYTNWPNPKKEPLIHLYLCSCTSSFPPCSVNELFTGLKSAPPLNVLSHVLWLVQGHQFSNRTPPLLHSFQQYAMIPLLLQKKWTSHPSSATIPFLYSLDSKTRNSTFQLLSSHSHLNPSHLGCATHHFTSVLLSRSPTIATWSVLTSYRLRQSDSWTFSFLERLASFGFQNTTLLVFLLPYWQLL